MSKMEFKSVVLGEFIKLKRGYDLPHRESTFFESKHYKDVIRRRLGGAAQPNANAKVLGGPELLRPSDSLLEAFRNAVGPAFTQKATLAQQNQRLREARDLLLPRLMNGSIAV